MCIFNKKDGLEKCIESFFNSKACDHLKQAAIIAASAAGLALGKYMIQTFAKEVVAEYSENSDD